MHRRRGSVGRPCLVAVLIPVLGLAACGGDDGGNPSGGANGGSNAGNGGAGTSITIGMTRQPPHLDRGKLDGGFDVLYIITDPLFRVGENGQLQPGVVESWERIGENTTRLKLREDVEFADGEKLNAESFKVNLDRVLEVTTSSNLETWTDNKLVDDYTVDILHDSQVGLLHSMAHFVELHSPRQIEEDPQSIETAPIGTGPYEVVNYESGSEVQLEARDDYWGADVEGWGAPSIDQVTIRYGLEPGVMLAGLQAGELDLIRPVTPQNSEQLSEDMTLVLPSPELFILRFGFQDEATSDPLVREAINLAIDREALNAPFLDMGTSANQLWPEHVHGWADRGPVPEPDPERAQQQIQEAGVDGTELELVYSTQYKVGIGPMSQAVAGMIEDVGLQVSQNDMDGTRYREYIREIDDPAPLTAISIGYESFQAAEQVGGRIACDGAVSTYCNDEVDRLLQQALNTPDDDDRRAVLQDLMDVIEEDNGAIPLIAPPLIWGKNAALEATAPVSPTMDVKTWELR